MASVKPIDAPALLRAARDTGAILVVEEHTVVTGLGEAVAATVAENFAVPVRRVGVPDLFEMPSETPGGLGPAGDRLRDEAWELLRLRGKVQ
jgi:transketolase C-terminal domain/subunit